MTKVLLGLLVAGRLLAANGGVEDVSVEMPTTEETSEFDLDQFVSEAVAEESEEVKGEDELTEESLKMIIQELSQKINDLTDNQTLNGLFTTLLGFIATLGALFIKFKSFDKANLKLEDSGELLKVAEKSIENMIKEVASCKEEIKTQENALETATTLIKAMSCELVLLKDELEKLTTKESD